MIYKNNFKFGITQLGDAGVDQSWTKTIDAVIGAVISSKMANQELADNLLKYKDKIIYHPIISGLGGTPLEPNVPEYEEVLKQLSRLINIGFPESHIVVRIDPIMPYTWFDEMNSLYRMDYLKRLTNILEYAKDLGIQRVRYNFLKMHPDVLTKLYESNPHFYFPDGWQYDPTNELSLHALNDSFIYESDDVFNPYVKHTPIVCNDDLYILGLYDTYRFETTEDYVKNMLHLISYQSSCPGKCIMCDLGNHKSFNVFRS